MVYKDRNGKEISVGDIVIFGEISTKGTVIGFTLDKRICVEIIEQANSKHGSKPWRYIFELPSGQTQIVEFTGGSQTDTMPLDIEVNFEQPITTETSYDK